jgi:putative ABC transport system permease protein
VSILDRKLRRDIRAMSGQVVTIAAVVAAGVAVFVASISTYHSLRAAQERFYEAGRFPQIFATLKRAPLSVVARLNEIPGIVAVEPRIVRDVILDWPESMLPVSARMVSLAQAGDETLSRLHMRAGAAPGRGEASAVAVNEAFAVANFVRLGQNVRVVLNGRVQNFQISGVALSSEYVYVVKPGLPIPDDKLHAILWIDRGAAEAAFDMKGAFNDVAVALAPGTDPKPVTDELDRLLEPYGSVGAVERCDHVSNRFLEDELNQQRVMSIAIPIIFFGIAAFLLNVALGRLVTAQREQIASLKALGFPTMALVVHYAKFVTVIVLFGSIVGCIGGYAFGEAMIQSYQGFFRFPVLRFELTLWSAVAGTAISLIAALVGVIAALAKVVRLKPAVAMRPIAPLRFRRSWIEEVLSTQVLIARRVMVLRNIAGHPFRTLLTSLGVAFAVPMVVLGLFWRDAINHMIDVQFHLVDRGNMTVTFPQARGDTILRDLVRESGVLRAEGHRVVPVRLRAGNRTYLTSVIGLSADGELYRPHDSNLRPADIPADGISLACRLADRLAVAPGDFIAVETMEGRRRKRDLIVHGCVDDVLGMTSYMSLDTLNQLMGDGAVISAAVLYVDAAALPALARRFKELPVIEAVAMKANTLASFFDKIAGLVFVTAGVLTVFAIIIAVGVVYNNARIGLQERAWELASLRVLGFTRQEVARIQFAEYFIAIAIGLPIGAVLSQGLVTFISQFFSNESFQIPAVIGAQTHAASVIVVIAAAAASAFVVRRHIDRLDLVSVLKTRD